MFGDNEYDEGVAAALSWFGLDPGADSISGEAPDAYAQRIQSIADPPSACPGCVALAGQDWPAGYTSQYCPHCLDRLRRIRRVRMWNDDPAHQSRAGKARAAQFTHESQSAAGHASFSAFSARWRASCGLAPLFAEDVIRYVTPDMIRDGLGRPIDDMLRETIYAAWCHGYLYHVTAWLDEGMTWDVLH